VFYYPEDCSMEMGPTALLPGSHFLFALTPCMGHYGHIRGAVYAAAPAGSIFITVYSIWHRRSASTASGIRNMLKYNDRRGLEQPAQRAPHLRLRRWGHGRENVALKVHDAPLPVRPLQPAVGIADDQPHALAVPAP
jgi:hypothetical protein